MKNGDIQIGGTYEAKVGPRWVEVEITKAVGKGGFEARGANGKPVRIKDAGALRPLPEPKPAKPAPKVANAGKAKVTAPAAPASNAGATDGTKAPVTPPTSAPAPEREPAAPAGNDDLVPLAQAMGGKKPTKVKAPAKAKVEKPFHAPTGLEAAVKVLQDAGKPMSCKDLVTTMLNTGLWKTDGKTPAATLNSALHGEIKKKGSASRFTKTGRGLFGLNPSVDLNTLAGSKEGR